MRISQVHSRTDTGRRRRNNEDAYVCTPPLFAIADGMGGAQAGEVASGLAAAALAESGANGGSGERRVIELVQEANRRVHHRSSTDAATSGMATTMTAALVELDGTVWFGHVGDSRAYLLRDGRLEQLTDDHTLVAELVRRGELSPSDAEVHPQRSVITRALGTDPDVDVDTFAIAGRPGDVYLLCSDGLSSMVAGETIERLLETSRGDLQAAGKALIEAANRGGGEDNITVVLFELAEEEAAPSADPDERTREHAVPPEDEETLHPEDGVAPPPPAPRPPEDTMVVPAGEIRAALAAAETAPVEAGVGKRLLALLVIALLIALIVVLVWWGLAR